MAERRLDALVRGATRGTPVRIVGGKGLRFMSGDEVLFSPLDSRAFILACLEVVAEGKAEWADKTASHLRGLGTA